MEADEEKPEMPQPELSVQHAAGGFWVPVIKTGEDCEKHPTYECVVKVRNDEVRVSELPVEGSDSQHDARQSRDKKLKEKTQTEEHRQFKPNLASGQRAKPVKNFEAGRH